MSGPWLPLLLFACGTAIAASELPPEGASRYQHLVNELRCLVCQNQSIAESNAPLAEDLRRQVHDMIQAGRSDEEILSYMTARYGDFVLYRPPLRRRTWVLWAGPFVLLAFGGVIVALLYRRARRPAPPAPIADPGKLREILRDIEP